MAKTTYRIVKWHPADYAEVCKAALKEGRLVSEYIRMATLEYAKKTNLMQPSAVTQPNQKETQ